jgi:hypothetical protein
MVVIVEEWRGSGCLCGMGTPTIMRSGILIAALGCEIDWGKSLVGWC